MTKCHPLIEPMIQNLHANGRLRVWTLVVTILGDVVQPRGGVISMSDLLTLTDHMSIDSGAIRTALSRLLKEKWVVGKKTGRTSSYAFGPKGLETFEPASERIYASVSSDDTNEWLLAVLPPRRAKERQSMQDTLKKTSALQTTAGLALWPKKTAPDMGMLNAMECLCFEGTLQNIPAWLKSELAPPEAEIVVQKFIEKYNSLRDLPPDLTALDAMIARILMLHDWRRLVLRYAPVPQVLQPEHWSMPQAHRLVMDCYNGLVRESELHWKEPLSSKGQAILAARFNPDT
jgi:phenylacetic acid degradation operon negative regulatory protein